MTTSSCIAVFALRIRVSMSAIGSFIVIVARPPSPARLRETGDLAVVGELPQAHAAESELAVHRPRPPAPAAPGVGPDLELGLALLLLLQSLGRHGSQPFTSERE